MRYKYGLGVGVMLGIKGVGKGQFQLEGDALFGIWQDALVISSRGQKKLDCCPDIYMLDIFFLKY